MINGSRRLPVNYDEVANFAERKRLLLTTASGGLGSWTNYIEPLYLLDKNLCKQGLLQMFQELINEANNIDFIIEKLLYHIYVAYYLISEGRLEGVKTIIEEVEPDVISKINNYKTQLSSSKKNEIDTSIKMIKSKGGLKGLQNTEQPI